MTDELRRICRQLRPIIREQAVSLWKYFELAETPQAKLQAANLIRMLGFKYLGDNLAIDEVRLPPPGRRQAEGEFHLGEVLYQNAPIGRLGINREELTKHVGIFATTGAGKTTVAWQLMGELSRAHVPFLAIDWKRSYRQLQGLRRFQKTQLYTIGQKHRPLGWNPLKPPPGTDPYTWIQILCEILERTHISGQGVADIFAEHAATEFEYREQAERKGDSSWPTLRDIRVRVERSYAKGRRSLWRESCLRILRALTFGPSTDDLNNPHPINLSDLLNQEVIFELDMALPKNTRTFIAEVVLRWIHLFRLSQGETNRLQHILILEEAHNLFAPTMKSGELFGSIENIYREIRSFGQGIVALSQHPSLLPIFALGNTHTLIFMALTHEADIFAARQALFLERGEERYLDLLKTGEAIVKVKGRIGPCHVRFPRNTK